ncbi:unnamed protein product, partial [Brachionus calyciflorus]
MLNEAVFILQPFYDATVELSGSKYSTLSKVIPVFQGLINLLETEMSDSGFSVALNKIRSIAEDFPENLKQNLKLNESHTVTRVTQIDQSVIETNTIFKFQFKFKIRFTTLAQFKEFFDYIDKEWINSKNYGWYEGHAPCYPSTNNALEGTNQSIKKVHTFRDRVPISHFLERAKIIMRQWSTDRVTIKKWEEEPKIKDEHWFNALDFIHKKTIIKFDETDNAFYLTLDSTLDINDYLDKLECNLDCFNEDCEFTSKLDFNTFFSYSDSVRLVKLHAVNWKFSNFTCRDYLKDYMCQHILVVLLAKKLIEVPEKYIDS